MATRKYHRKSNKFRKTRSKRQRGGNVNNLIQESFNGDILKVKKILEEGDDINAKDIDGNTALQEAISNGHIDIVKLLLEKGADVNQPNNDGDTAIIHAIHFGDVEIVKLLLEDPMLHIYPRDDGNYYEVELAKDMNENEIADLLNKYIETRNQKDDNIEELSNYKRPNISSLKTMAYRQGPSALDTHINLNPGTIKRPYGKLGGKRKTRKKNSRGRKTRSKRQRGGDSEAQEEKDKYLFDAIDIYDYDKVENALNNGANVNAQNKDGDTPLIRAIKLEDIDMVYLLLEYPDINIELDVDTNKELQLAEDLWENMTPEDQEENGIPYAIEDYIETKNKIKKQKDDNIKELSNYKRPNISSLKTMAYRQGPSALDTHINLNPGTINRPYGKLGGKRKTNKSKITFKRKSKRKSKRK